MNIIKPLIAALLLLVALSAQAAYVNLQSISVDTAFPSISDPITATISGTYVTPGFTLSQPVSPIQNGTTFDLTFLIDGPQDMVPQVISPFSYDVGLGSLSEGSYDVNAHFYIYGTLQDSISTSFFVRPHITAAPLPAAAWLLISGIAGLFTVSRRSNSSMTSST